jgi:DNA-binding XRE family transcriptional regulator
VTRRELAEALGVHYQTVGYLERGEYNPSLHLALRIAEFFGLPVETISSINPLPRISDLRVPEPADDDRPTGRTA